MNKLKQQGTVTRRTLATSTTSYSFTFNLARKCLKRRYTSIFSFSISSKGAYRVFTYDIFKSNYNRFLTDNLYVPEHSAISLACVTVNNVFSGLKHIQRQRKHRFSNDAKHYPSIAKYTMQYDYKAPGNTTVSHCAFKFLEFIYKGHFRQHTELKHDYALFLIL